MAMLQALKPNRARRPTGTVQYVPPPVNGWNAKDDLSNMKPEDAVTLDNLIPTEGGVKLRRGCERWVTSLDAAVETLMTYSPESGADEMFAAAGTEIFDVTLEQSVYDREGQPLGLLFALTQAGDATAQVVSGLTNGRWQHVMFSNSGNNYLVAANGADAVQNYNGSTWSEPTITGVTASDLINVQAHQSRLWFVEKDSMSIWYLAANAIAGAATEIDFSAQSKLGGTLVAMATWTRDGGSGMDDLAVFITSEGEAHVYSGTDPDSASTWQRVGTFKIPRPLGFRCVAKVGGDVAIITEQGLLPLSAILPLSGSVQARAAATERIQDAFSQAARGGRTLTGWQVIEHTADQLLVVNIPKVAASNSEQYVMNAITRAWCRFDGFQAACWGVLNSELYFGTFDGDVFKYTGTVDETADSSGNVTFNEINGTAVSAFQQLGTPHTKSVKRVRAQFFGPAGFTPTVGVRVDYADSGTTYAGAASTAVGATWDVAVWDEAEWAQGSLPSAEWKSVTGEGFAVSVEVSLAASETATYNGSKVLFEIGDAL